MPRTQGRRPEISGCGTVYCVLYRYGFICMDGTNARIFFDQEAVKKSDVGRSNFDPNLTNVLRPGDRVFFRAKRKLYLHKNKYGPFSYDHSWTIIPGSMRMFKYSNDVAPMTGIGSIAALQRWKGTIQPDDPNMAIFHFSAHVLPRTCSDTHQVLYVGQIVEYNVVRNNRGDWKVVSVEPVENAQIAGTASRCHKRAASVCSVEAEDVTSKRRRSDSLSVEDGAQDSSPCEEGDDSFAVFDEVHDDDDESGQNRSILLQGASVGNCGKFVPPENLIIQVCQDVLSPTVHNASADTVAPAGRRLPKSKPKYS